MQHWITDNIRWRFHSIVTHWLQPVYMHYSSFMSGPDNTRMGTRVWSDKPSLYVTSYKVNSHPCEGLWSCNSDWCQNKGHRNGEHMWLGIDYIFSLYRNCHFTETSLLQVLNGAFTAADDRHITVFQLPCHSTTLQQLLPSLKPDRSCFRSFNSVHGATPVTSLPSTLPHLNLFLSIPVSVYFRLFDYVKFRELFIII